MDKVFFQSVDACIDELMVRFIINAPEYELVFDDNYRPMFLFEKAFYYYKDYTYHHGVQLTMGELIKECKNKNNNNNPLIPNSQFIKNLFTNLIFNDTFQIFSSLKILVPFNILKDK